MLGRSGPLRRGEGARHFRRPHHGRDLVEALQELDDLGLVGRLHPGEAAGLSDGVLLVVRGEVVELATREGLAGDVLVLAEDANAATDGHRRALVVACERETNADGDSAWLLVPVCPVH